ncbi:Uncharacterised protein [Streptococcus pneumoniae]|nr:Uncharacterised protein [Streptococcus pneumoniae]CJB25450.1 Uncharacterised protein [Streptococcus pneumoniae]CKF15451.1 Uncharacterised protein [Streptococcus pneumoniae]
MLSNSASFTAIRGFGFPTPNGASFCISSIAASVTSSTLQKTSTAVIGIKSSSVKIASACSFKRRRNSSTSFICSVIPAAIGCPPKCGNNSLQSDKFANKSNPAILRAEPFAVSFIGSMLNTIVGR